MKKLAVIILVAFTLVIVVSSCNKKDCPAYSRTSSEQVDKNI